MTSYRRLVALSGRGTRGSEALSRAQGYYRLGAIDAFSFKAEDGTMY